ncbi:cytochrome P450 [Calocera viscosa TUFC12733]|uniref:Cytochrome P450 n=1 Tax=Calocera viscosa (strain TUFC12733) TaxID=1330018 RepID=A0A167QEX7_CALVF|nr:cytochrome P450 [Calocera viscosa TUFC12733]
MPLPSLSTPSTALPFALLTLFLALYLHRRSRRRFLPPGPNPLPLIGNLRLPDDRLGAFKEWAVKYGEVMTIRIWGMDLIVLNSQRAALEVLEKRAGATSGRPRTVMAHELVGFADVPSQTNDPVLHKRYRRLYASAISTRGAQRYWGIQERELRKATLDILAVSGSPSPALKRAVAAISFLVAYGYDIENDDDELIVRVNEILRIFEKVLEPGAFLVDIIPLLKHLPTWFPGAGFKRLALRWKKRIQETREAPFERVKRDMATGKARSSFCSTLLEQHMLDPQASDYDEEIIKATAASIYSAGSDTSVAAIQTFLAAMVLFPAVQDKAQTELDRVIGRDRLPSIEDRDILPYCSAIVQEVLRWHPVTPLALPHVLEQDEEFRGYVLPKGATIIANVWAMTRGESIHARPEEFVPERHLTEDGTALRTPDTGRHASLTFGFGRRVCPGSVLAEATVFAAVVSTLWACTLSRPPGTEDMVIEYEMLGVHRPKDFPIDIKQRFPGAKEILHSAINE